MAVAQWKYKPYLVDGAPVEVAYSVVYKMDDKPFVQVDQVVHPAPGSADPMNGALPCGAPLPNPTA